MDAHALLSALPDRLLLLDGTGRVQGASLGWTRWLQRDAAALRETALADLCEDDAQRVQEVCRQALRSSLAVPVRLRVRVPAGAQSCRGELVRLATADGPAMLLLRMRTDDGPADRFAALNERIAALNREIQARRRAEEDARAQREWLHVVLRSIGDAVIATDLQGRIVFLNPVAEQLTGWPADDAAGQPVAAVFHIVNEETRAPVTSPVDVVLREGRIVGLANHTVLIARDGRELPIDDAAAPIADEQGRMSGVVLVFREISERVQAERERRALEQRLREAQKMEAIGTLAGGIAHDFNNVLGAILGNVQLLQQEVHGEPRDRVALVDRAARRGRELVRQILAFSRRQPQQLRRTALQPIVHETTELLRSTLPSAVALQVSMPDEPLPVLADPTQLSQVVMNLCTNGWHALQGRPGRVQVRLARHEGAAPPGLVGSLGKWHPGPWARLSVTDTGCGMDAATLTRVFEPFFSTKPRDQGTGLGLPVVHGIVAEHRGMLAVHSTPGAGTCFEVLLPLLPAGVAETTAAPAAPPVRAATGRQVLYVDDDEVLRLTMQAVLSRAGFAVATCDSVSAALRWMAGPDAACEVVVSDFNMPHADGLELARALRQRDLALPIVITSGYLSEDLVAAARGLDVRLLHKEAAAEQLPELLHELLG
jgi:PAS domain S-box-containing protein